jgi:uncharacterized protein (TIGR02147 family)
MVLYEYKTVPTALEAIFELRRKRNPNYSLRAFARDMGKAPSSLSAILSEQQKLSPARTSVIGTKLALSKEQSDYLIALAAHSCAKTQQAKMVAKKKLSEFSLDSPLVRVSQEQHEIYGSWEALAIVEALKLTFAKRTLDWLAATIGTTVPVIEKYCDVLIKHNFIERDPDGLTFSVIKDRSSSVDPAKNIPTPQSTIRQFHASILQQATSALDEQPLSERDISAIIYAGSAASTNEVKEAIKNFRRALMASGEASPEKDSVYCLSVQWFKLGESPTKKLSRPASRVPREQTDKRRH